MQSSLLALLLSLAYQSRFSAVGYEGTNPRTIEVTQLNEILLLMHFISRFNFDNTDFAMLSCHRLVVTQPYLVTRIHPHCGLPSAVPRIRFLASRELG